MDSAYENLKKNNNEKNYISKTKTRRKKLITYLDSAYEDQQDKTKKKTKNY